MSFVNTIASKSFENDYVQKWTPITFAVEFTIRMRKKKNLDHYPSIRSSIAIPKFLTARYMRKYSLYPADYIEAAVYNSSYEDQKIALDVAREILFPKEKKKKGKNTGNVQELSTTASSQQADELSFDDPMDEIFQDLADLNINLGELNDFSDSLDNTDNIENQNSDLTDFKAFNLFEELLNATAESDQSLGELLHMFGGPSQMEALQIFTKELAKEFITEKLQAKLGDLQPEHIFHGSKAGFSDLLVKGTSLPWEYSSSLLGSGNTTDFEKNLSQMIQNCSARDLGKIIKYIQPFQNQNTPSKEIDNFIKQSFDKVKDLMDFASILDGLSEWVQPSQALVNSSITSNMHKSYQAGKWLDATFDKDITPSIVDEWIKNQNRTIKSDELLDFFANTDSWKKAMEKSLQEIFKNLKPDLTMQSGTNDANFANASSKLLQLAKNLENKNSSSISSLSQNIANYTLTTVMRKDQYLPILDNYLENKIYPSNIDQILQHATKLGFDSQEILERFGDALKQLEAMIEGLNKNADRYNSLLPKIKSIPNQNYTSMAKFCEQQNFKEGMAALVSINLNMALQANINEDFITDSINFKGIGGGENLLKEWFTHRGAFKGKIREKIKELAKEALLDLSMDWRNKGSGSIDKGIIPQTQTRPFLAGDDLDLLDIEETLVNVISAGKNLDQITTEDLFVYDTSKGQSAITILIDISGSMSGQYLAMCAITAIMLIGKLHPEEIALAYFESDTHVVKGFSEEKDLDEVADQLLDLKARGGTRIDQAMNWATMQFEEAIESEFRLLFILSDFCVSEKPADLKKHIDKLYDLNVRYLGASHGMHCKGLDEYMVEYLQGYSIKLTNMKDLPALLTDAIDSIGDNGFS